MNWNQLSLNIPFDGKYSLDLLDVKGKVIDRYTGYGPESYTYSKGKQRNGIYFLRLLWNGKLNKRMIVVY